MYTSLPDRSISTGPFLIYFNLIYLCIYMYIYFRQHNVHSTHCSQKGLSRFCFFVFCFFCFVSFCCCLLLFVVCCCCCLFTREDKSVASLACLATQVYFPHSPLSLGFFFLVREDENMLNTSLATQAFRHTGLITTLDYFLTGLFCHRFIRHMGPLYAFFLPHRSMIGKVKILHASTATKNYLPHRFVACFKVTQVFTKL